MKLILFKSLRTNHAQVKNMYHRIHRKNKCTHASHDSLYKVFSNYINPKKFTFCFVALIPQNMDEERCSFSFED